TLSPTRTLRQPQAKLAAFRSFALHTQTAAERSSQTQADGQAETVAFTRFLGAEKWIEYFFAQVRRYSAARVSDLDNDTILFATGGDGNRAAAIAFHSSIDGIAEQVDQDLPDHLSV